MTAIAPNPDSANRMAIFDALPVDVRAVLNDAAYPFEAVVAANLLRRGRSPDRVAAVLAGLDRRAGWKGGAA